MSLPEGWAKATFSDVADAKLGKMLDAAKNQGEPALYLRNVSVRWGSFDLSDLQKMRVTPEEIEELSVRDGDVFVCEGGEPGRAAVWRGGSLRLVYQKALHRLRALDDVCPDYLSQYLRFAAQEGLFDDLLTGTTIKHLPQVALNRLGLPVPPAAEQRRIVERLYALTARLARARADLARAVILTARWRQTAYARLYGDRWGVGLQSFLSAPIRNGLSIKGSDQPPGIAALKLSALRSGTVDLSDVRFLPIDETRAAQYSIQTDDVLVSRGNGNLSLVGRAAVVSMPLGAPTTIFPDTAFRLRPDPEKADPQWLSRVWNSPRVRAQIEARARTTAGIWKISQRDLAEIQLPELPVDKQRSASAATEAAFARADRLEAEAARAHALLDRLEAAILAKAFRGELFPQDPADEPAAVLLDRIRAQRASAPAAKRGRRPPWFRPDHGDPRLPDPDAAGAAGRRSR